MFFVFNENKESNDSVLEFTLTNRAFRCLVDSPIDFITYPYKQYITRYIAFKKASRI